MTRTFTFSVDSSLSINWTVTLDMEGRTVVGVQLNSGTEVDWDGGMWQVWNNHNGQTFREQMRTFLRKHIVGGVAEERIPYMARMLEADLLAA